MAIAFVQSRQANTSGSSAPLAYTSNVTAGSLLVVGIRDGLGNSDTITVTDSNNAGNWSSAVSGNVTVDGDTIAIFYRANAAAGPTTVTVTLGGSASSLIFTIAEYSGIATTTPLDQTASGYNAGNNSPTSGNTATLAQASELVIGVVGGNSSADSWTQGTGFTARDTVGCGFEDQIVSSTSAIAATFTTSGSPEWRCLCATFKGAGGGGGVSAALTGQSAAFTAGTLSPATSPPLSGQSAAFTAGTLIAALSPALSGIAATFSSGLLSPAVSPALTGIVLRAITGTVTAPGSATPVPIEVGLGLSLLRLGGHSH